MNHKPTVSFEQHTLQNALQVVLCRDNRVPLAHVSVHYRVGSSYENPGCSGLAHLFEHMMFEGSNNIGKNEHGRRLDAAGGSWNASTNKDRTNYHETLPSNYLDLALWLEADRMRSLRITPQNFENQRQTVIEEKKQSYDNRPYGCSHLRFDELCYSNWAYAHPIIGSVEDLERLDLTQALDFHRRFYGPGNAVIVVAGDIDEAEALGKIERYFGSIPDHTSGFKPDLREPAQTAAKEEVHRDQLAALPALLLGFHIPEFGSPEYYALSLLSLVLAHGESSRLYGKMIYDRNWLTTISAGPNQYKGPGLFTVWCQLQDEADPDAVLSMLLDELRSTAGERITERELERARNNIGFAFLARLMRVSQVAETLAQYSVYLENPDLINVDLDRFFAVSADDIRDAAAGTFQDSNRTTIKVIPGRTVR